MNALEMTISEAVYENLATQTRGRVEYKKHTVNRSSGGAEATVGRTVAALEGRRKENQCLGIEKAK